MRTVSVLAGGSMVIEETGGVSAGEAGEDGIFPPG